MKRPNKKAQARADAETILLITALIHLTAEFIGLAQAIILALR